MKDPEHGRLMLAMAEKDLKALKAMTDLDSFSDEIFGFHAQQAVEKALKAWLSATGIKYPKIHDLEQLVELLKTNNVAMPVAFADLADLTDYSVIFRYEMIEKMQDPLDRKSTIEKVEALHQHVRALLPP